MKNRAKCKLCDSIIESFHSTDYVICKCGEIAVDKGPGMWCFARNWSNFLRVDDNGNEIIVKVQGEEASEAPKERPSKQDLVNMLIEMRKGYERLPQQALINPISHYDHLSLLMLLESLFTTDC